MKPLIDGDSRKCNNCEEIKLLEDFHKNKVCSHGRTRTCKKCISEKRSKWYSNNKKRRQQEANRRNQERKKEMVEYFGDKCFDCQQTYPQCVYEFHHLKSDTKDVNPSKALSWSYKRRWKELSKCIMLCSNCHKIRHWGDGARRKGDRDETIN